MQGKSLQHLNDMQVDNNFLLENMKQNHLYPPFSRRGITNVLLEVEAMLMNSMLLKFEPL